MRVLTSIFVLTTITLGSRIALADDVPQEVTRAHAAVQKNATTILKLAYPTAHAMAGATEGNYHDRLGGGFTLDEKFSYTDSDDAQQSFTLRLKLDEKGAVTSISEEKRSELWPTFGTGNLLLAAIKSSAQDQVDEARRNNQEPSAAALLILKADDVTDVVAILVNTSR